jgi:hypothetical protein
MTLQGLPTGCSSRPGFTHNHPQLYALLLVATLASCAYNPNFLFDPPYPIQELTTAQYLVDGVVFQPWLELRATCGMRAAACIPANSRTIYIMADMTSRATSHAYWHEVAHLYEIYALMIPLTDSAAHLGWRRRHSF